MSIILWGIIFCEAGFWVLLLGGLSARYIVKARRLSSVLLLAVPLLDVVLLVLIGIDLAGGNDADFSHGLGAVYLGFTACFGKQTIRALDVRFAHRFAGGPMPVQLRAGEPGRLRYEWITWFRVLGVAAIASVILGIMILMTRGDSGELMEWVLRVWVVSGIWLLLGPLWELGRFPPNKARG